MKNKKNTQQVKKTIETGKTVAPNTHVHDRSLS